MTSIVDTGVPLHAFEQEAKRHRRTLVVLFGAFLVYYLALLVASAWFPSVCALRVFGRINLGLLFALSQYVFGGLVAWAYVRRMRVTDEVMNSLSL